jgi:serine protease Do
MRRAVLLLCVLPFLAQKSGANEDKRDPLARALQARIERAARVTGPSIACVYVSRSDVYRKPLFAEAGYQPKDGKLGRFDAAAARKRVSEDVRNRARLLRSIREHDLSDPAAIPESYGSGIVVDSSGLVLTNAHVVRNATKIYVRLSNKRGSWADIHASDPRSDLAVLKLLDPPADLKAVRLGDGGNVRPGQFVLCMANSYAPGFRAEPTISSGLVSALRQKIDPKANVSEMERSKVTLHHYGTLIQTDAKTTPGCSGGALLDLDGKVIGLTTALAGVRGDQPGGFAIPFNANTRRIIDVLKRGEEVEYGFLGVMLPQADDRFGGGPVRITQVVPGSPASARLQAGDQIVSINGNAVNSNSDLFLFLGMLLVGNKARVEVARGGRPSFYEVELAKFYVPGPVLASKRPPAKFGLRVDYTSILSQRNPFLPRWGRAPAEGVVVREVIPDSPADKKRLQPDKIITAVNGQSVTTPAEYYREMARTGDKAELTYLDSSGRAVRLILQGK